MCMRLQIVILGEQTARRGTQSERAEHPAGDVLHVRLLHLRVGLIGQVRALSRGYRDQLGLILHRGAHQLEIGISPLVERLHLSIEEGFARQGIEPLRSGDRQRPQQQRIDQPEGSGARADGKRQ